MMWRQRQMTVVKKCFFRHHDRNKRSSSSTGQSQRLGTIGVISATILVSSVEDPSSSLLCVVDTLFRDPHSLVDGVRAEKKATERKKDRWRLFPDGWSLDRMSRIHSLNSNKNE
jgi:hypothetical protein